MLQKVKDHFVHTNEDGDVTITFFSSITELVIFVLGVIAFVEFIIIRKNKKNK